MGKRIYVNTDPAWMLVLWVGGWLHVVEGLVALLTLGIVDASLEMDWLDWASTRVERMNTDEPDGWDDESTRSFAYDDMPDQNAWYMNHYRCPCGTEWDDEWDGMCNDHCPSCDKEVEPHASDDLTGVVAPMRGKGD